MPVENIQSIESRLAEIEAKLSFAEDLLEELNRTVYRQQQQCDRLQQELHALRETIETSGPAEPGSPGDEVPPHY
ncbi:MAG: SlyX family protein [Betaproteobacteria bacterium]|nr:SlyX family protein [Betaproteobacteria bacterium]